MAKITKRDKVDRETVTVRTQPTSKKAQPSKWWMGESEEERALKLLQTASYLKENGQYRYRQASMYSRLYNNMPLYGIMGGSLTTNSPGTTLPLDRPTMNVIQSCVDTLISRITQARPRPVFLTDNGDYKARNLAKQLNQFILGEFHQTKAYEKAVKMLLDASVLGTGILKVYEKDRKVALQRVLPTEILVDNNDGMWGEPRQMYQVMLIDRDVLADAFPDKKDVILRAEQAFPDNHSESSKTVSDQVMVVEGWHLPSGEEAGDGMHTIAVSSGPLLEEEWIKPTFPFVFLNYAHRMLGFWGQPLTEQLMGTQLEINKLLATISASINLVGVPRVFVEDGSKVVKAHLNNQIGAIITYRGTKPEYAVAPCVPQEIYAQLQRLVEYAYQQSGVSALAATAKKPEGLNSGVAMREYDDLQSDRFASLVRRYDNMFIDLAYQVIDLAKDIAERDGEYQSVYPGKDGTREVNLPEAKLLKDPFVIQCFDASSLPRDPAGRMQKVTELIQAGMIDIKEGRRLLDYPDLQQNEKLDNASEERILQALDQIVGEGIYTTPDPFMDPELAIRLSRDYYNLYVPAKLEPERAEMLRTFNAQAVTLQQATLPPAPLMPSPTLASPEPVPTTPLLPQGQG